ncbi:MerR family transcriptional regulator [Staphylococcus gallinarum]|uniref:MerR family transcriptional regulator n=2 Tax=Staphylococcus gallinarum TaxID=1293 RepID=UPI000E68B31E|nr:MerR family transcriptional regulator [Staphylococcus gallinarum]MCD8844731.1 MerR family transcriptional regulator [Staphylococcus gallinarum]RIO80785.1 MerR family transcriptional regulator [Staphylococcus gallinarum]
MMISEVSKSMNISVDTLRYYEKIGIIPKIRRNANGIRNYSQDDLNWVKLAKCMRQSGLSIDALSKYIELYHQGEKTKDTRRDILYKEREILLENIEEMQETLTLLNTKIAMYDNENVCFIKTSKNNNKNINKVNGR